IPVAELNDIENRDWKAAVDLGLLRQIGDLRAPHRTQFDPSGQRSQESDDSLQQRGLAGAVGTDDRGQRARPEAAAQMMDRRMAVIAQREIIEPDGSSAHDHQSRAQPTAAHSSSMMHAIQTRRPSALCPNRVALSLRSANSILAAGTISLVCCVIRAVLMCYGIT